MSAKSPTRKLQTNVPRYLFLCLALGAIITKFTSCCKGCPDAFINVYWQNYSRDEIDTIIQLRYQLNSNFTVLLDSNLIDDSPDKTDYPNILHPDADYIIKIPSVQKTFKISDYQIKECRGGCGRGGEYLSGFKLDGEYKSYTHLYMPR